MIRTVEEKGLVTFNGITYNGKFQDRQLYGNNLEGKSHFKLNLNPYQSFLYNRAVYGLAVYSQEEIQEMHWDKRKRVLKVHKRAQTLINLWKQEKVNLFVSKLFTTLFPNSRLLNDIAGQETDETFINKMSFKALKITKKDVIDKFISEGILPNNFFEFKPITI